MKILHTSPSINVFEEEIDFHLSNFTVTQNYQQIKHLKQLNKIVQEKNDQLIYNDVLVDDIELNTKRRMLSSYFPTDELFKENFIQKKSKLRIGLNRKRPSNESKKWRNSIILDKGA